MKFTLYFIYYVSFAILAVVSLEISSLRTSESDFFTTEASTFLLQPSPCCLLKIFVCFSIIHPYFLFKLELVNIDALRQISFHNLLLVQFRSLLQGSHVS